MKALASDFDGTLYFFRRDPEFYQQDLEKIREFQQQGSKFGICTGRSLYGIQAVVKDRISFDFYIIASGALILDGHCQEIARTCITKDLAKDIYQRYEKKAQIVFQANDTVYSFCRRPLQTLMKSFDDLQGHIYGLSFGTDDTASSKTIAEEINALYGDEISAFQNVCNVDIAPKGCSKGNALRIVKDALGIDYMGGIGDSYNDLPMLQAADHAFTFPYAPEDVQRQAADVVEHVADAIMILQKKEK